MKFRPTQLDNAETVRGSQNGIQTANIEDVALLVDPGSNCEDIDYGDGTDDIGIGT